MPHGFSAKVSDFGLAREMDIQSKIATNTTGTVTYMPPETIADGMVSKVGDPSVLQSVAVAVRVLEFYTVTSQPSHSGYGAADQRCKGSCREQQTHRSRTQKAGCKAHLRLHLALLLVSPACTCEVGVGYAGS